MNIKIKRVYMKPEKGDGKRVLVDRLWPRGLTRDKAGVDIWLKDIAPSDELRQWYGHEPARWGEFECRYFGELDGKTVPLGVLLEELRGDKPVTLLYSARDEEHNNAVALKEYVETKIKVLRKKAA